MQKRAVETKNKILSAAVELFASGGMKGTTVDSIAAAAGVNKQRIYAYFGSKEKLFIAALTFVFKEAEVSAEPMLREAEKSPERLTEILLVHFHSLHENAPCFWRLLAWANLEDASLLENLKEVRSKENSSLRRIFEQNCKSPLSFECYLFSLLAVSWFLKSNAQTLPYTLGFDIQNAAFSQQLFKELSQLF